MKLEEFNILENDRKLEAIFKSVEKTRKYIKWTVIASLVFILLPLIILPFLAANLLNINRTTLYNKMKEYQLL